MSAEAKVWLLELPSGETVAVRCTEEKADQGERGGWWTVRGSARLTTLAGALISSRTGR